MLKSSHCLALWVKLVRVKMETERHTQTQKYIHTRACGYSIGNINLVLLGNRLRPMRSIRRDSGMQEKNVTILISWME